VTLKEPQDGLCFDCGSEVPLRWSCPYILEAKDYYRLDVWGKERSSFPSQRTYHKGNCSTLANLSPGIYNWAVTVVRSIDRGKHMLLSEESDGFSFEIAPPAPVVHSISPTCTVQGTGVTVVVSGENLTRSLAFTVGVPLKATFVNSGTITATIPITLEVGEYDVIVKDSLGQGDSYASFLVSELVPLTPQSASLPWDPAKPVPTAPPGYNPTWACVVNPCALAPQLIDPQDDTEFAINSSVELRWEWAYCLPPEWKFAIRISETSPPHSYHYEDNPKLISCENGKAVGRYRLPEDSRFRTTSGTYYWNIAVARSVEGGWERLSEYSETRWLVVKPGEPNGSCPVPPCE
jgi:hypothetical protein